MEKTKKIWFDGKLVDWQKAKVHLLSHALHYGSAVFEGIRCYKTKQGPAVFRLQEHLKRFFYSAQVLAMELPFNLEELKKAVRDTIKANKIEECYIRPIAFYGYGKMGLNPKGASLHVAIAVWPWGKYLGKEYVKVKTSQFIRLHPRSIFAAAKVSGYYVNSIFATLDAQKKGYDEALLLDHQGYVAEGPGENIFFVKNETLLTPALGSILPGITRASLIQIAKDLKIPTIEKKIKYAEIKKMEAAFFVGTAVEVCPIKQIDRVVFKSKNFKIVFKLKEIFERIVRGEEKKYLSWLTFVR